MDTSVKNTNNIPMKIANLLTINNKKCGIMKNKIDKNKIENNKITFQTIQSIRGQPNNLIIESKKEKSSMK